MKQLRLVKVLIQPVFVLDDGDVLEEVNAQPQIVNAADWPSVVELLEKQRAEAEAGL